MAERQAESLEVIVCEFRQYVGVNGVDAKRLFVLLEPEASQPTGDVQGGSPETGSTPEPVSLSQNRNDRCHGLKTRQGARSLAPLPLWRTCIASAPRASAPRVNRSSDAIVRLLQMEVRFRVSTN